VNNRLAVLSGEPPVPTAGDDGTDVRPLRAVYVGRIAVIKNLDVSLQALRLVTGRVDFDVYGPVEDPGYWATCQRLIADLPRNVVVTYRGEARPEEVRATFAAYDVFLFPTRGESFGHAIAESLSVACPVICSTNTPWTDVLGAGGGVALDGPTPVRLAAVIETLAGLTLAERLVRRESAARAYRSWLDDQTDSNVLHEFRLLHTIPTGSR
jgi:glycosyltransferase involved in cell wall biosynthesis